MEDRHLQFGHLLYGVFRSLFAHTALFDTTIRHQVRTPLCTPVDHQITRLNLADELHRPIDVLCEDRGTQPVVRIVGERDCLVNVVDTRYTDRRSKDFITGDLSSPV